VRAFDLVVIGSGPAGQRAAIQAAKLGKEVAIIERQRVVGGVCINTGTIPSKTLREAVLDLSGIRQRVHYGESFRSKLDVSADDLLQRAEGVMRREREVIRSQLQRNGVRIFEGCASFESEHVVVVDDGDERHHLEAPFIVIAVGTTPGMPAGLVVDHQTVLASDDLLHLRKLPRSLLVVGAGIIGLEYATIFGALGIHVTLVDKRRELLADMVDREITEALAFHARERGVTLRLGEEVAALERPTGRDAVVVMKSGKRIATEMLLVSAGRVGATKDLALEKVGLTTDDRGRISVNEHFQTARPHIYAVGDVIGFPALASTSMEQGRLASCHAFGRTAKSIPGLYPFGIYAIPEIAWVGRTEESLTAEGIPFESGTARYKEIARGNIVGDPEGMLKLLFHLETRRILGVWGLGTNATELVHVGQAVMAHDGTLDYFVEGVFNYPTLAECYKVAALDGLNKLRAAGAVSTSVRVS
jgi:NAD(P) transhydrogenase